MRAVAGRAPLGLIGGIGGAVGALPVVSAARKVALGIASLPQLPGVEKVAGDVKLASFMEAAALLVAVPLAAFLFGALLPRRLEARTSAAGPSFEWAAAGFAAAFPIWRSGAPAHRALLAGAALALIVLSLIVVLRHSPTIAMRVRDVHREPVARVLATAVAWELARGASAGSSDPSLAALCLAAVVAAVPFLVLPLAHDVRSRA
jgi:hypothetical protein